MSKFSRFNAKGKNVQVGDGNKQVNVTNNFHGGNGGGDGSGGGDTKTDPLAFGLALIGFLALLMWGYTQNVSVVTTVIAAIALVAGVLAVVSALVLVVERSVDEDDMYRAAATTAISTVIVLLSLQVRQHLPAEVIQLAQEASAIQFWKNLLPYGKALVASNFIASLTMGFAALAVLFGSARQALYAFANSSGEGIIYRGYTALEPFRMRFVGIVSVTLLVLAWAALKGYLMGSTQ